MKRLWAMVTLLVALAGMQVAAQAPTEDAPPAILVADSVFITPERKLIAEGNVEAIQGTTRLTAQRVEFDRDTDTLTIQGPIRIDEGGRITVLANFAEMDKSLQNGLLTGARMVLDQQVQMAALQMTRVRGRYTQLYKTAVTSCHVCDDGRPPLWQIRARRITHDQAERQLYFEEAQLLVYDLPVFYIPSMRLPDPSLDRATGFLIPKIRTTSNLGTGLKLPYFIRLGDHSDLTLSPYLSGSTQTLDYRYRQAFRRGRITIEGAHTRDDLQSGEDRGYIFANGYYLLNRGYRVGLQVQTASDDAYLVDYGLPDLDRLQNEISVSRYKDRSAFRTRLIRYKSLRDDDDDSLLPTIVFDSALERRFFPRRIGGELRVGLSAHHHRRSSDLDVLGRDVTRAGLDLTWQRSWLLRGGLRADWTVGFAADTFDIDQDSAYPDTITRTTPGTALSFRLPMRRAMAGGAVHYLEPILQVGWTSVNGDDPPNDESSFVEFDRGNLLALSHFPAEDRRDNGAMAAYGLNWERYGPRGLYTSLSIGQILRRTEQNDFTRTSGLGSLQSDVLVAGQVKIDKSLTLTARTLLDEAFSFSKAEFRGDWSNHRARLSGTYLWLGPDTQEDRDQALSEVYLDGGYDISPGWSASASLRYDISDNRATRAGLGLVYSNECLTMDFSLSRRFTSSTSIEPTTDFGFTIALSGFSVEKDKRNYRRSCSS